MPPAAVERVKRLENRQRNVLGHPSPVELLRSRRSGRRKPGTCRRTLGGITRCVVRGPTRRARQPLTTTKGMPVRGHSCRLGLLTSG